MRLIITAFLCALLLCQIPYLKRSVAQNRSECFLTLIEQMEDPFRKSMSYVEIAKLNFERGNKEEASKLIFEALKWAAKTDRGGWDRDLALSDIAEIAYVEHLGRAVEIARNTQQPARKNHSLGHLIVTYGKFGLTNEADALLSEAIETNRLIKLDKSLGYNNREGDLSDVLVAAARAGLAERALQIGLKIKDRYRRGEVLRAVAIKFAEQKKYQRAIRLARDISYEIERIDAIVDVANVSIKTGNKPFVAKTLAYALSEIGKDYFEPEQDEKTKKLIAVALAYAENGQMPEALDVLKKAEQVAYAIEKSVFRDLGITGVAKTYARFGLFEKSLEVMNKVSNHSEGEKWSSLAYIADRLIEAGQAEKAYDILSLATQSVKNIDCNYSVYKQTFSSCYEDKARNFLAIAKVYEKHRLFEKETDMFELVIEANKLQANPPGDLIDGGYDYYYPIGESELVKGFLAAGKIEKALEVAVKMEEIRERIIAIALIEFKLAEMKGQNNQFKDLLSKFSCN